MLHPHLRSKPGLLYQLTGQSGPGRLTLPDTHCQSKMCLDYFYTELQAIVKGQPVRWVQVWPSPVHWSLMRNLALICATVNINVQCFGRCDSKLERLVSTQMCAMTNTVWQQSRWHWTHPNRVLNMDRRAHWSCKWGAGQHRRQKKQKSVSFYW